LTFKSRLDLGIFTAFLIPEISFRFDPIFSLLFPFTGYPPKVGPSEFLVQLSSMQISPLQKAFFLVNLFFFELCDSLPRGFFF